MKKSFSVNIDGRIFSIDEDAYELLQSYLQQLGTAFGNGNDSDEIVSDIEARVAEHLSEMCPSAVVSIRDINAVIDIIGHPEQLSAETSEAEDTAKAEDKADGTTSATTPPPYTTPERTRENRKLFRDVEDCVFGGVLSGLAKYNDWNTTTVRLCAVIIALLTTVWPCILAYIIAWIIIPPAQTAEQKLRMMGKPVTAATIGQTVRDTANRAAEGLNNSFFSILGRAIAAFAGFMAGSIGIGCAIAAVCALFLIILGIFTSPEWVFSHFNISWGIHGAGNEYIAGLAILSVLLAVIIPCLLVVWGACVAIFKVKGPSRGTIITLCIIEFVLIVASILMFNYLDAVHTSYIIEYNREIMETATATDSIPTDSIPADTTATTAVTTAAHPAAHTAAHSASHAANASSATIGTALSCIALVSAVFVAI